MTWLAALWLAANIDFAREVHPLLAAKCFACHSGDKREGGLSLGTYREVMRGGRTGKVVEPGNAAESLLLRRVLGEGVPAMPPAGERLGATEIAVLRKWIEEGARPQRDAPPARPNWKPPLTLARPPLPPGADHPIDRLIGGQPRRAAGDADFARRAWLDAWGLLPAPEQLARFLASPDRPALVERLLADRRNYSEHWISFWNDLLRNDEGVNYHGGRKSITSWLLSALEENLPYDRFVAQLLNPVQPTDPDGFLLGVNWRGEINASQTPVMQAAQNSAQVFLGVNLKCNSCHDSFISRWKLADAYGLASFFAPDKLELVRCDIKLGQFADPRFLYPELGGIAPGATLAERRQAAASLFTGRENGRFARTVVNRIWKRLLGRGLVEPVDDMDGEPWNPRLLDWLAADFVDSGYDLKALIARIMTSRAYQLPAVEPASEEYVFAGPLVRRLTAEQLLDAVSAITGEWRLLVAPQAREAQQVREWRLASSPMSRALGRPIRDQVFTERNQEATTLQAIELVNGETYARLLARASRKMLGDLPPAPANRFDSGRVSSGRVAVDADITGAEEVRLLVADLGSYSPERVVPVWAEARWIGPGLDEVRIPETEV
ncbi:MAG: PSD1 and planctomycete cytochrome C domain-containing protein, partial [Bryobacteraceae bacterium]